MADSRGDAPALQRQVYLELIGELLRRAAVHGPTGHELDDELEQVKLGLVLAKFERHFPDHLGDLAAAAVVACEQLVLARATRSDGFDAVLAAYDERMAELRAAVVGHLHRR